MSAPSDLLRRYLRQRAERGETELILDRFGPEALHRLRTRSETPGPAVPAPAGGAPAAPVREPAEPTRPAPPARALPSMGAAAETARRLVPVGSLEALRDQVMDCHDCGLCDGRSTVVFGEGNPRARVVVVGEAPGAEEDRTGRPFVGRAGKLLDLLLASAGFPRESVYICNVLKCRPPGNRDPLPDEVAACSPHLRRQVELIGPRAIVAFGTFAAQTLLESSVPIGRLRGGVHEYQGVPLVPTYHPAALLRNPGWLRPVWEDLQRLRSLVDAA